MDVKELRNYLNKVEVKLEFAEAPIGLFLSVESTECSRVRAHTCPTSQKCVVTLIPMESVSYDIPVGYMGVKREERCYCEDGTQGSVCYPSTSCLRNPCKFGEKCIQTTSSYRCECIDPSKCDLENELSKTFSGDSYMKVVLKKPFDELFTSLSINFKTESQLNEILFYANGKDYFIVETQGGFLQARFDFGSGVGFLLIENTNAKVTDGRWHHMHIQRMGNYVKMSLDKRFQVDGTAPGATSRINNGQAIVFGAGVTERGM